MRVVIFYLTIPLLFGISKLPFRLLYLLSDGLYLFLFTVIGYRKAVVTENLLKSFPEKTGEELKQIRAGFYRFFCDLVVESVKNLTISESELKERLKFEDTDVFRKHFVRGQSVVVLMGHWGNWELAGSRFALEPLHKMYVVYKPQRNPQVDKLTIDMRTRFGNKVVSMKNVFKVMLENRDSVTATTFIADQVPSYRSAYRMRFLNQDTPVFLGAAKIACKMDYPVIYAGIKRIGRGQYLIHLEDLESDPKDSTPESITERFFIRLEEDIRATPEIWLWSHKRWKHSRKEESNE